MTVTMLSQRAEEFRQERMLQNYNENFSELRYPQLHMPPPADYNSLVQHVEQPWYNNYSHSGAQNGGTEFFSRGSDNKTPSDWNSYHSDTESPFIPPQMNNNSCGLERISPQEVVKSFDPSMNSEVMKHGRSSMSPYDGQYSSNSLGSMMGQQMQMEGPMMTNPMMSSTPDPLMINEVNGLIPNGVETPSHPEPSALTPKLKEEELLSKLDISQSSILSTDSCKKENVSNNSKDPMKLPGFHQTFGNITEIGRFSQHDDYFETRPVPEVVEAPKVTEPVEAAPKRKPRGRKRKQPEPREVFQRQPYTSPEPPAPCLPPEPPQWQYPPHHMDHNPHQYPHHHHHHHQWRSHPYYHQQHYHHHYPPPTPPPNPYYHQHYNDCAPPYHYNSYQSNWHANRDYMVPNYSSYV
uniref:Uncharacterized protein n=1 Tax=Lygus hesperus TaxID=30085 RepID=A0A146MCE1_LYGHE